MSGGVRFHPLEEAERGENRGNLKGSEGGIKTVGEQEEGDPLEASGSGRLQK